MPVVVTCDPLAWPTRRGKAPTPSTGNTPHNYAGFCEAAASSCAILGNSRGSIRRGNIIGVRVPARTRRSGPSPSWLASRPPVLGGKNDEKTIQFVLAGNDKRAVTIPCDLASDGAMLLTAFLALAYSKTPDRLRAHCTKGGCPFRSTRDAPEGIPIMRPYSAKYKPT